MACSPLPPIHGDNFGSRGPPWAERGNNCTLWAGFGDWSLLTTGFRNKSPLWATHRNRSPFWARLRIWGPFWAGHETKSPLWAERGLRVLSGLDSGTASIEATSEASSWEWPPWPWQEKQPASEEPLLTRPTRIVPVDKTRLMDKVSKDMMWPWSWAGADTGVNSGAGADSLFFLRFLLWLEVRDTAAVGVALDNGAASGLDFRTASKLDSGAAGGLDFGAGSKLEQTGWSGAGHAIVSPCLVLPLLDCGLKNM